MTKQIVCDLAENLGVKIHRQMADYLDLCHRSDCDMQDATDHMLGLLVGEAITGMITMGMSKKEVLEAMGVTYDLVRPDVEEEFKEAKAKGRRTKWIANR